VLTDAELEVIAHGPPGARWVLYEVPFKGVDDALVDGAEELRRRGFGVLLAHPERSRQILEEGIARIDADLAGVPMAGQRRPLLGFEGQGATRRPTACCATAPDGDRHRRPPAQAPVRAGGGAGHRRPHRPALRRRPRRDRAGPSALRGHTIAQLARGFRPLGEQRAR
jgi:hypothetical protein